MAFQPFKTQRIDYLLFVSFAGFIIVLLVCIGLITYSLTIKELAANTSYYQQRLLNEITKQVSLQMKSVEQQSLSISKSSNLMQFLTLKEEFYDRQMAQKETEEHLAYEAYSNPSIHSIQLFMQEPALPTTRRGVVAIEKLAVLRDEEWYPQIENADFAWIRERTVRTDYEGEQSVVSFARKLYDPTGGYRGLLVLNVNVSFIEAMLQGENPDVNRILLDSGGRTIAAVGEISLPDDLSAHVAQMDSTKMYSRIPWRPDSTGRSGDSILVLSNVAGVNWNIVELSPWNRITQSSLRIAMTLVAVGVTFIVVSLFFTLFMSRQFVRPIRLLLKEMSAAPKDTMEASLPTDYQNEFGALFKGYRKFVDRIRELYQAQEDKHLRQREVEIRALQAMINPHFLYNTLDQANWMAIEANQVKISKVIALMGRMFRIGLSNGSTFITIRDEIDHIQSYMEIQQIRWEQGLTFSIQIPEEIRALYIPKLTLQPFVENAIIHGFHSRDKGNLRISAEEDAGGIRLIVQDDGIGIDPEWHRRERRKTGGYGIKNVLERMEAYFGSPYGVHIAGDPDRGTIVSVYLPKLTERALSGGVEDVENCHH